MPGWMSDTRSRVPFHSGTFFLFCFFSLRPCFFRFLWSQTPQERGSVVSGNFIYIYRASAPIDTGSTSDLFKGWPERMLCIFEMASREAFSVEECLPHTKSKKPLHTPFIKGETLSNGTYWLLEADVISDSNLLSVMALTAWKLNLGEPNMVKSLPPPPVGLFSWSCSSVF